MRWDFTTLLPVLLVPYLSCGYPLNYSLIMVPNRNLRIQNAFTLGFPPPTLACPHCLRHFRSKGGRTKHIRSKHPEEGSDMYSPNPSVPPSPMQSLPQSRSQSSSPIPPNTIPLSPLQSPSHPPSPFPPDTVPLPPHRGPDSVGSDIENPFSDLGHVPPGLYSDFGNEMNREPPPRSGMSDQGIPDPPRITRIHHPKLNGNSRPF
jgi:hypothetical protein